MPVLLCTFAAAFLAMPWLAHAVAGWSPLAAWAYLALSAATFAAYALDKRAARAKGPRTPEAALHLWALAGGWPGALLAQQALRHKSAKAGFIAVLWLCVAVNCALLYALWRRGLLAA